MMGTPPDFGAIPVISDSGARLAYPRAWCRDRLNSAGSPQPARSDQARFGLIKAARGNC
jgi:hypothetical protein